MRDLPDAAVPAGTEPVDAADELELGPYAYVRIDVEP